MIDFSHAGGVFLLIAGLSLMGRSALLSGKAQAWPTGPRFVRWPLTMSGLFLCAYGYVLTTGGDKVSAGAVGVFGMVSLYNVVQFVNVMLQRRERRVYSH